MNHHTMNHPNTQKAAPPQSLATLVILSALAQTGCAASHGVPADQLTKTQTHHPPQCATMNPHWKFTQSLSDYGSLGAHEIHNNTLYAVFTGQTGSETTARLKWFTIPNDFDKLIPSEKDEELTWTGGHLFMRAFDGKLFVLSEWQNRSTLTIFRLSEAGEPDLVLLNHENLNEITLDVTGFAVTPINPFSDAQYQPGWVGNYLVILGTNTESQAKLALYNIGEDWDRVTHENSFSLPNPPDGQAIVPSGLDAMTDGENASLFVSEESTIKPGQSTRGQGASSAAVHRMALTTAFATHSKSWYAQDLKPPGSALVKAKFMDVRTEGGSWMVANWVPMLVYHREMFKTSNGPTHGNVEHVRASRLSTSGKSACTDGSVSPNETLVICYKLCK